jgi:hypothetical protein
MTDHTLTREERESVLVWNEAEETAILTTSSPFVRDRLLKRGLRPREIGPVTWQFELPKRGLRYRVPGQKGNLRIAGQPRPAVLPERLKTFC